MRMTIVAALTGSIGSGKSTVAAFFEKWGAVIVDSDVIARKVVEPNTPGYLKIIEQFGRQVLLPNSCIDRKALGELVFADKSKRATLESIVHPLVQDMSEQLIQAACNANARLVICAIPLLFESGRDLSRFQAVVLVTAPKEASIERTMKRDGISRDLAEAKWNSQMSPEEKFRRSTYLIDNTGSLSDLEAKSKVIYNRLLDIRKT